MTKFVDWFNFKPAEGERFTQPSMTLPDQVLSLQKLLLKHTAGGLTVGTEMGYTTDGTDMGAPIFGDMQKLDRAGKLQKAKDLAKEGALLKFELDKQSEAQREDELKVQKQKERELLKEEVKRELTQEK